MAGFDNFENDEKLLDWTWPWEYWNELEQSRNECEMLKASCEMKSEESFSNGWAYMRTKETEAIAE